MSSFVPPKGTKKSHPILGALLKFNGNDYNFTINADYFTNQNEAGRNVGLAKETINIQCLSLKSRMQMKYIHNSDDMPANFYVKHGYSNRDFKSTERRNPHADFQSTTPTDIAYVKMTYMLQLCLLEHLVFSAFNDDDGVFSFAGPLSTLLGIDINVQFLDLGVLHSSICERSMLSQIISMIYEFPLADFLTPEQLSLTKIGLVKLIINRETLADGSEITTDVADVLLPSAFTLASIHNLRESIHILILQAACVDRLDGETIQAISKSFKNRNSESESDDRIKYPSATLTDSIVLQRFRELVIAPGIIERATTGFNIHEILSKKK